MDAQREAKPMEVEPSEVAACGDWPAGGTGAVCPRGGRGLVGSGAMVHLWYIGRWWMASENPARPWPDR
uniref:Uncharacterized protein n=1 Tax=Oryza rufipogon TaxID=4529 RepID=A0A0E0PPA4_ORYRU